MPLGESGKPAGESNGAACGFTLAGALGNRPWRLAASQDSMQTMVPVKPARNEARWNFGAGTLIKNV
jgi:hypothetical protein